MDDNGCDAQGPAAERPSSGMDLLIRKLTCIAVLSAEDRGALLAVPPRAKAFKADQDIVREGDRPIECALVLEGLAFRHRTMMDGRRQIMSFHPPGDLPDLQSLHLDVMDHSIGALVPTKIAFVSHRAIEALAHARPGVNLALWRESLIQASIFREWLMGLGRRSALQRVAHLLCEMAVRLEAMQLGTPEGFQFPVTQAELADALGLSAVHANRVVQELRRSGLLSWRGAAVCILDWEGLQQAAGFDRTYLHLEWEAR